MGRLKSKFLTHKPVTGIFSPPETYWDSQLSRSAKQVCSSRCRIYSRREGGLSLTQFIVIIPSTMYRFKYRTRWIVVWKGRFSMWWVGWGLLIVIRAPMDESWKIGRPCAAPIMSLSLTILLAHSASFHRWVSVLSFFFFFFYVPSTLSTCNFIELLIY